MLFWIAVAAVLAYVFRGTLTVVWANLWGAEQENRRLVSDATALRNGLDAMNGDQRAALQAVVSHISTPPKALPPGDAADPVVAGFQRDERELDAVEQRLNEMRFLAQAKLDPDSPLRRELHQARAALAERRRRLAEAVRSHEDRRRLADRPPALPATTDDVENFLQTERELDQAEAELQEIEAETVAQYGGDSPLLDEIEGARLTLAADRQRLAEAVTAYDSPSPRRSSRGRSRRARAQHH